MNSGMLDSLISIAPIIVLIVGCVGIVWSVLKNRSYFFGFSLLLLGAVIHYWGLQAGKWEGMSISLFYGGGMVLLGLLTLLITFIYSKMMVANKTNRI